MPHCWKSRVVSRLKYDSFLDERKIIDTRKAIDMAATHHLRRVNVGEHDFWEQLKNKCLLPSSTAFGLEEDLKREFGLC